MHRIVVTETSPTSEPIASTYAASEDLAEIKGAMGQLISEKREDTQYRVDQQFDAASDGSQFSIKTGDMTWTATIESDPEVEPHARATDTEPEPQARDADDEPEEATVRAEAETKSGKEGKKK